MTADIKNKIRIFTDLPLQCGIKATLTETASHYLCNVMRISSGAIISCFNGKDGEYDCKIISPHKKQTQIEVLNQTRTPCPVPDLWLLFSPLKKDCNDFVIEKATELGVSRLQPVFTSRTGTDKIRPDRYLAQAVEAAEQCRRVDIPEIADGQKLNEILLQWNPKRRLYFMDESGRGTPVAQAFASNDGPAAILVGPEGGFNSAEIEELYRLPFVSGVSLGPRILRAETAAAAALSIWQAVAGDWL